MYIKKVTMFKILTYNNHAGIVADAMLLQDLIYNNVNKNVDVQFTNNLSESMISSAIDSESIGVWIQNPRFELLNNFKKNIWFINEEWTSADDFTHINDFDYVVCKSKFAKDVLGNYRSDVIYYPMISYDYYNSNVARTERFLHFNGKSIQKNTELIMKQTVPITIIDSTKRFNSQPNNINYITNYRSSSQIKYSLNAHTIHLCPSIYESWGHYLFEGLSTGSEIICSAIPSFTEHLDPDLIHILPVNECKDLSYCYDSDNASNQFPLRKSYYIDPQLFNDYINNFVPKGSAEGRRQLYLDIMFRNKNLLIEFFRDI